MNILIGVILDEYSIMKFRENTNSLLGEINTDKIKNKRFEYYLLGYRILNLCTGLAFSVTIDESYIILINKFYYHKTSYAYIKIK